MIQDLPSLSGAAPDRSPARNPLPLNQCVGDQVIVCGNLKTMKISHLPNLLCRIFVSLFEHIENELAAESAARGADFPKCGSRHPLKIFACCPEFQPVKQWLTLHQLVQDRRVLRCRNEI